MDKQIPIEDLQVPNESDTESMISKSQNIPELNNKMLNKKRALDSKGDDPSNIVKNIENSMNVMNEYESKPVDATKSMSDKLTAQMLKFVEGYDDEYFIKNFDCHNKETISGADKYVCYDCLGGLILKKKVSEFDMINCIDFKIKILSNAKSNLIKKFNENKIKNIKKK